MVRENCYLIWDDTQEATLIDCGAYYPEEQKNLAQFIKDKDLKLTHLYNTHGHFDHIFGSSFIYNTYGVKIELCKDEKDTYEQAIEQMRKFIHIDFSFKLAPVERFFKDGDILPIGKESLQVIATPGHTPGGVCFYNKENRILFSGDSIFRHEIGRCDLPGGNEKDLVKALKSRILTLPEDTKILPGHGEYTTVKEEQVYNPYIR